MCFPATAATAKRIKNPMPITQIIKKFSNKLIKDKPVTLNFNKPVTLHFNMPVTLNFNKPVILNLISLLLYILISLLLYILVCSCNVRILGAYYI